MARQITQITRRDIIDAITAQKINVYGRLEEIEFLSRIWDLDRLPSYDSRHSSACGDIVQHRVANYDWEDDWIFSDDRLNLLIGDDEIFLTFLCETLHPVVRPDVTEAARICQLYNTFVRNDGFKLVETSRISGKPVYSGRHVGVVEAPGIRAAKETLTTTEVGYVAQQITRMELSVETDPDLAIGTAKELVESCCKSILDERGIEWSRSDDLPRLVKKTVKELRLTPEDIPDKAKAVETVRRLLSNLATITQGLVELRGHYGTGHGRHPAGKGLQPRHAKLAVGAASTLAVFLADTHRAKTPTVVARSGKYGHIFPEILATLAGQASGPFVPPAAGVFGGMGGQWPDGAGETRRPPPTLIRHRPTRISLDELRSRRARLRFSEQRQSSSYAALVQPSAWSPPSAAQRASPSCSAPFR